MEPATYDEERPTLTAPLKISLCLMVWNELENCRIDVPLIPRELFAEVFAVDGGSRDGTAEYLNSVAIPVYPQPVRSLNAAYHYAVECATGDALVVFFPKGTIDPDSCLREFVRQLNAGHELVIASRNIKGAQNEEDGHLLRPRKWGVQALSLFIALVWRREGPRIHDVLHGVKAFRRKAWREMAVSPTGVTIDLETAVRSYRLRLKRTEFPVVEKARLHGATKFAIWPTSKRLASFLIREMFTASPKKSPDTQVAPAP